TAVPATCPEGLVVGRRGAAPDATWPGKGRSWVGRFRAGGACFMPAGVAGNCIPEITKSSPRLGLLLPRRAREGCLSRPETGLVGLVPAPFWTCWTCSGPLRDLGPARKRWKNAGFSGLSGHSGLLPDPRPRNDVI